MGIQDFSILTVFMYSSCTPLGFHFLSLNMPSFRSSAFIPMIILVVLLCICCKLI